MDDFSVGHPCFLRCVKKADHFPLDCLVCWRCQGCLLKRHSLINLQSLTDTSFCHRQVWVAVHSNIIKHPTSAPEHQHQFLIIKHQSSWNITRQKWWGCASLCLQEVYFHYMEPQARQAAVASASRGLCQAPVTDWPQTVDLPDY